MTNGGAHYVEGRLEPKKGDVAVYEKTPADHVGHMARGSSVQRTKRNTSEKVKFFGKVFILYKYDILLGK